MVAKGTTSRPTQSEILIARIYVFLIADTRNSVGTSSNDVRNLAF